MLFTDLNVVNLTYLFSSVAILIQSTIIGSCELNYAQCKKAVAHVDAYIVYGQTV